MPLRNRMTPLGEPIAVAARGLVYANRGNMHDAQRHIRRPYGVRRWIACQLEFRGWHRGRLMQPGRFTELFFLDEATAFAAGHRPCRLCRYVDYEEFVDTWSEIHPHRATNADAIDDVLHAERWDAERERQRHHEAAYSGLPTGTFVLRDEEPWVVLDDHVVRWTPEGYERRTARPTRGRATVITPPSLVKVLRTERTPLVPFLHPSAFGD
jgi:hypothetical protein